MLAPALASPMPSVPVPPPPGPQLRKRGRFYKTYDSDHRTGAETRLPWDYSRYVYKILSAGPGVSGPIPGLYSLHQATLACEVGRDLPGFLDEWAKIEQAGLGRADWDAPLVYLPHCKRTNGADSPKTVLGWSRHWELLPECALLEEVRLDFWLWMHLLDRWHKARDGSYVESIERVFGRRYQIETLDGVPHLVPIGLGHGKHAKPRPLADLLTEDLRAVCPDLHPSAQVAVHAWAPPPTILFTSPTVPAVDPAAADPAGQPPADPAGQPPADPAGQPPADPARDAVDPHEVLAELKARSKGKLLVPDRIPPALHQAFALALALCAPSKEVIQAAGDHLAEGGLSWVGSGHGVPIEWLTKISQEGGTPWAPNLSRLLTEAKGRIPPHLPATPATSAAHAEATAQADDAKWLDLEAALQEEQAGLWPDLPKLPKPSEVAASDKVGTTSAAQRLKLSNLLLLSESWK